MILQVILGKDYNIKIVLKMHEGHHLNDVIIKNRLKTELFYYLKQNDLFYHYNLL